MRYEWHSPGNTRHSIYIFSEFIGVLGMVRTHPWHRNSLSGAQLHGKVDPIFLRWESVTEPFNR
jgi:hypothetical protein